MESVKIPTWFDQNNGSKISEWQQRVYDLTLIIALSPLWIGLMSLLAVILLACQGCPVIFKQKRVGRYGAIFRIWKFRTMNNCACQKRPSQVYNADDSRVTLLGKFLRKTHLDELPQIINVITGDMSLVGPRPLVREETEENNERESVRPGITCLTQLCVDKNDFDYLKIYNCDLLYIHNKSFRNYALILFFTVIKILKNNSF